MNSVKEELFFHLAEHTDVMHLALEGSNINLDDRMIYLGHLGMCARIFKSIFLNEPPGKIMELVRIERSAFKLATPRDERGSMAKESWEVIEFILISYLEKI